MKLQFSGGLANGLRGKLCRFNQQIHSGFRDFGFTATHHSAQSHRLVGIRNDTHPRCQGVSLVVNRDKFFLRSCLTTLDAAPTYLRQIEGMQRLTAFHHDIIRGVHDVIHRVQAQRRQLLLKPSRTHTHLDAPKDSRSVSRAQIRTLNFDLQQR